MDTLAKLEKLDPRPARAYLAHLTSPASRRSQETALGTLAALALGSASGDPAAVPWAMLRRDHVLALRALLAGRYAPATANRHLAALRGVLREAWRSGALSEADFRHALDAAKSIKGSTVPAGRDLDAAEIKALVRSCADDLTPSGARDGALLALLVAGGLRRSEPISLDVSDFEPSTGRIVVRGKGRKERVVFLRNGAARAVSDWIALRGDAPGPLLCPVNKGGRIEIRRMTPQAVLNACEKRAALADVSKFSPHDLRRTYAGDMLDAGVDLSTVQRAMGHASPTTTARYDRRDETAQRDAAGKIHFPWKSKPRSLPEPKPTNEPTNEPAIVLTFAPNAPDWARQPFG